MTFLISTFSADRDIVGEQEHILEQQHQIAQRIQESRMRKIDAEKGRFAIEQDRNKLDNEITKCDVSLQSLGQRINKIQEDRRNLEAIHLNQLAKFGRDAPKAQQIIQHNAARFERVPIGPIGRHNALKVGETLFEQMRSIFSFYGSRALIPFLQLLIFLFFRYVRQVEGSKMGTCS